MIRLPVDREALLAEALSRVTRRRDIGQAFERLGPAREELANCLDAAFSCVHALARPAATIVPASLQVLARDLDIESLGAGAQAGARGFVYLLGCGYDSRDALARLEGDYTCYHFQDAIAREIVFALGREVSRWLRTQRPGWRFVRQVLRDGAGTAVAAGRPSDTPRHWDPRCVGLLLRWFEGAAPQVTTTSAGGLAPLHSLLGLMVGKPDAQVDAAGPRPVATPAVASAEGNPADWAQPIEVTVS